MDPHNKVPSILWLMCAQNVWIARALAHTKGPSSPVVVHVHKNVWLVVIHAHTMCGLHMYLLAMQALVNTCT